MILLSACLKTRAVGARWGEDQAALPREGVRTEQARKRRVLGRTERPPLMTGPKEFYRKACGAVDDRRFLQLEEKA